MIRYNYSRLVIVVITVLFILLPALTFWAYQERHQSTRKEEWIHHTHMVILKTERLISYLKDIETGQRGFLLTRDSSFLEPYMTGNDSIAVHLKELKTLVTDNAEQQALLNQVEVLINKRLVIINKTFSQNYNEKQLLEKTMRDGKKVMDDIREKIRTILYNEEKLLNWRLSDYEKTKQRSQIVIVSIIILAILYFLAMIVMAAAAHKRQRMYEQTLLEKNQELAAFNEEMDAMNEELKASNEELSATNEEFLTANEELNEANKIIGIQAENLVRQSEEKLNDLLASLDDIISSTRPGEAGPYFINNATKKIVGYDPEYVYKNPSFWSTVIHPDDLAKVVEARKEVFESGHAEIEFRIKHAEGHIVWLSTKLSLKRNENNQPVRIDSITRDISREKEAQLRLVESERKYKYLFEHNPLPLWIYNPRTFQFLDVNLKMIESYGYSREEFLGMSILDIRPESERKSFKEILKTRSNPDGSYAGTFTHRRKDGSIMQVEVYSDRFTFNDQEAHIVLAKDVTQQKIIEKEKEHLTNELIMKNNDLEEFAYVISHNLRAPVANILGLISVFRLPEISEDEIKFTINKIFVATSNLDMIVKDINEILSLRDSASDQKILTKINVEKEILTVLESIESSVHESKAEITWDFSEYSEITILKPYFHNIAINLLTNAIKYRDPERTLKIFMRTFRKGDYVCFSIMDNGLGLDTVVNKNNLFKLYKRFHNKIEGKGMGLYLIKNQVTSMGGKIEVESEVGKGSTFTICIPVKQ